MEKTFLFEQIIIEGRLEDVKKKYPDVDPELIDFYSQNDPSGNNKYLDWMVSVSTHGSRQDTVKTVNLFHKNINKLTKELLDEFIIENNWEWLLTDDGTSKSSSYAKTFKKIYKSPKDIQNYEILSLTNEILKFADERLSKSEIKKLESEVLLNNNDLLITIPKSYKSSCFYGSGTRWCTTNKAGDSYYQRYTTNGKLIYIINKKESSSNPWYKAACFINNDGAVTFYDAPDKSTNVETASKNLGSNWEIIKDTIINYLYKNNLKGIDEFYFGSELISWLESKGLDPLETVPQDKLIDKLGLETLKDYLEKRGKNLYLYFDFEVLFKILKESGEYKSIEDISFKLWNEYKKLGINPLTKMFTKYKDIEFFITLITKNWVSLDEFLYYVNDEFLKYAGVNNLFEIINKAVKSTSDQYFFLKKLFKDTNLIFGYAKASDINLVKSLTPSVLKRLVGDLYDNDSDKVIEYFLNHADDLKENLKIYGFFNEEIIDYCLKNNKKELLKKLVEKNLLIDLSFSDYLKIYEKKEAVSIVMDRALKEYEGQDLNEIINDMLMSLGRNIKQLFSNPKELNDFVKLKYNKEIDILRSADVKVLWDNFYNMDYYELYKGLNEAGYVDRLDPLVLTIAYVEAPIDEKSGLKNLVVEKVSSKLKGNFFNGFLTSEGKKQTLSFDSLCYLTGFFSDRYGNNIHEDVLCDNDIDSDLILDFFSYDIYETLDDKRISSLIKEHLIQNFVNDVIVLDMDLLDVFDTWVESIDREDGTFTFTLTDEKIRGIPLHKLELLLNSSRKLSFIREVLNKSYLKVFSQGLKKELKKVFYNDVTEVFGSYKGTTEMEVPSTIGSKRLVNKKIIQFNYDYFFDDIVAYAEDNVWYSSEFPSSISSLIDDLMNSERGRFEDGTIKYDSESLIEESVGEVESEWLSLMEDFADTLYQELSDIDYD